MSYTHTCITCSAEFQSKHRHAVCCSRRCNELAQRAKRLARTNARKSRVCAQCSSGFIATAPHQKFCTEKCKTAAHNTKKQELLNATTRCCIGCAAEYHPTSVDQKFCSLSCAGQTPAPCDRTLVCVDCAASFSFAGRGRCLRCPPCRRRNTSARVMKSRWLRSGGMVAIGVGSGGNQRGSRNSQSPGFVPSGVSPSVHVAICTAAHGSVCLVCGWERVDVHHIDRNPANNEVWNLVPLCPNHHDLVHVHLDKGVESYQAVLMIVVNEDSRIKIAELSRKAQQWATRTEVSGNALTGAETRK